MSPPPASGDTIFALSSGRPPAAVAIIRISGPGAVAAATALAGLLPEPRRAELRRLADPTSGEELDRALVLRFAAPASATGEDVVELHCHGGRAVVAAVLAALGRCDGLRPAEPGEFTRRALANGRIDLTEAEGLADLLEAETEAQRKAALGVAGGAIRRQVETWREAVVALSARAEAAIDYVGDEDETAVDESELRGAAGALALEIASWLSQPRAERLKDGVRIVVAGPPNAGKSSLINALAGDDRAIVTDVAGTTRDVIEVPVAIDGLPLVLVDTAGLRDGADPVERIGIARAEQELARADVILWLGAPSDAPRGRLILLHPRCDLHERRQAPQDTLAVSAREGTGLAELWSRIAAEARSLLPDLSTPALNERQAICLDDAEAGLSAAARATDIAVLAHNLAAARRGLDRVVGAADVEAVLDALFGRFCLGK